VLAGLSECYDKVNIVADYCGAEEHLHTFSATASDGDLPLTSNYDGEVPSRKNHRYALHSKHSVTTRKEGLDKRKFSCTIMGTEPLSPKP